MKKRLLALMSAVMVMVCTSLTVFAASPAVGTTENPVEGQEASTEVTQDGNADSYKNGTTAGTGFVVTKVSSTTVASAGVATQNVLLNNVAKTAVLLGRTDLLAAADDSSATVTADILSVVDVAPSTATKDANGVYTVTLNVDGVKAGDVIAILHYGANGWELIVPSVVGDGYVTFTTTSLSPISVVKMGLKGETLAAGGNAPRTGETIPVMALVLIAVGGTGAVVFGRKAFKAAA